MKQLVKVGCVSKIKENHKKGSDTVTDDPRPSISSCKAKCCITHTITRQRKPQAVAGLVMVMFDKIFIHTVINKDSWYKTRIAMVLDFRLKSSFLASP